MTNQLLRAQGCLMGQIAGDSLGSLVEFQTPQQILSKYPDGVRELANGGTFNTLAGQPTDDSEMALILARMIIEHQRYDPINAMGSYIYWLNTNPFDVGNTISSALIGTPNPQSQANGALMRISPLGIFGSNYELEQVSHWAEQDASLTHPHLICRQINSLFTMAISYAVKTEVKPQELYEKIIEWAKQKQVVNTLINLIEDAAVSPPNDYLSQMGWVIVAFQNAIWQLLHSKNLEEGVVDSVMRGGDTDTNAAIAGALLGAVYGLESIPQQWHDAIITCRPESGKPNVYQLRPKAFWPVDALELAEKLINT